MWTDLSRTFYLSPSRIKCKVIQGEKSTDTGFKDSLVVGMHLTRPKSDAVYFRNALFVHITEYVSQLSMYKSRSITLSIFHVSTLVAALCSNVFPLNNKILLILYLLFRAS